jgi:chromosome segregation ATPase
LATTAGAAVLAIAVLVLSQRAATIADQAHEVARLGVENRELRSKSQQLSQQLEELREKLQAGSAETHPGTQVVTRAELPASTLEAIRTLGRLKDNLVSATSTIEQLRARMQVLETQIEELRQQNRTLGSREADLEDNLAGANRLVGALQAELKGKSQRLAPLQAANESLRQENDQIKDKLSRVTKLAAQLEEINRRREDYLSNILRRYRDVTEQYRAFAAQADSPAAGPAGGEVSRIQNAISMTEEDLRQLNDLNAQAERLQRRMTKD